jgi:Smg protein
MKPSILDILIYLFEHYMDEESEYGLDHEVIGVELREAGFEPLQINKAFEWLEGLALQQSGSKEEKKQASNSIRVYTRHEVNKLDLESRGFLMFLEQVGVLDARSRELVIDRLMALETDDIDLEQVKWVALMVLFNQPGHEEAFSWMEDLVMDEYSSAVLH